MRKLLLAGIALAAPLAGLQFAHAANAPVAPAAAQISAALSPGASVQHVVWVYVGGHRVWHGWGWHPPYWHPWGWHPRVGWAGPWIPPHWVPGHWRYGAWVPPHFVPGHYA